MVYGVVLVMSLAVAFAINGQPDQKYETLQSEVSDLKTFVFNMNVELGKVREQHDEMRQELMALRSSKQSIDKHPSMTLDEHDRYPEDNENNRKDTLLNKRVPGYTPSFSLSSFWNGSEVSAAKGEKGDSGIQGPNGDIGTKGQKGDTGITGAAGQKGNNGTPGIMGLKGDTGRPGSEGQKGNNGASGAIGLMGPKGNTGIPGGTGQKGDTGTPGKANEVFFAVRTALHNFTNDWNGVTNDVLWNHGDDYNSSTGVFTCEVPGVYLFTVMAASFNPGDDMMCGIRYNQADVVPLHLIGSTFSKPDFESATALLTMTQGSTVHIKFKHCDANSYVAFEFEGVLLY